MLDDEGIVHVTLTLRGVNTVTLLIIGGEFPKKNSNQQAYVIKLQGKMYNY